MSSGFKCHSLSGYIGRSSYDRPDFAGDILAKYGETMRCNPISKRDFIRDESAHCIPTICIGKAAQKEKQEREDEWLVTNSVKI